MKDPVIMENAARRRCRKRVQLCVHKNPYFVLETQRLFIMYISVNFITIYSIYNNVHNF